MSKENVKSLGMNMRHRDGIRTITRGVFFPKEELNFNAERREAGLISTFVMLIIMLAVLTWFWYVLPS